MKTVDSKIRGLVFEIIFIIILITFSIPIWKKFNANNYAAIAASYANMSFLDIHVDDKFQTMNLLSVNDQVALKMTPYEILAKSFKLGTVEYKLVFSISKKSTLDYKQLKVIINGEIIYLKDLPTMQDGNNYYVSFYEGILDENTVRHEALLYIDEDYDVSKTESIILNIEIQKK